MLFWYTYNSFPIQNAIKLELRESKTDLAFSSNLIFNLIVILRPKFVRNILPEKENSINMKQNRLKKSFDLL